MILNQHSRPLTQAEFQEWMESLGTKAFRLYLRKHLASLQSQWASQLFLSSDPQQTHLANVNALAEYKTLENLLDLSYEKYLEVVSNANENMESDEQERPASLRGGDSTPPVRSGDEVLDDLRSTYGLGTTGDDRNPGDNT